MLRPGIEPLKAETLCERLGIVLPPELAGVSFNGVSTIEGAGPDEITFVARGRFLKQLPECRAGAVLVPEKLSTTGMPRLLRVGDVWRALLLVLNHFFPPSPRSTAIHPTAIIPASATLGSDVQVGAYTVLGENVRIGDGARIRSLCCVGNNVEIGAGSFLHDRVTVAEGSQLGKRVILHSGAVIGADGFKYEILGGIPTKIPQVGNVVLGDDVEIGANSTVDRASLSSTVIGARTKLDNVVHVGHNVQIGTDCYVVAGAAIGGSTKIGNRAIIGPQVGLKDNIEIGDGVKIGPQSGVHTSIAAGREMIGTPPMEKDEWFRMVAILHQLPGIYERLRPILRQGTEDVGDE